MQKDCQNEKYDLCLTLLFFVFAFMLFFSAAAEPVKRLPGAFRTNLLRPEDMPGYESAASKDPIKDEEKSFTLDDGTVIVVKKTHVRKEALADCLDDFPEAIQKIVAPFI